MELMLMESYLSDRKQYVEINGEMSTQENILTGVPQGSILGPLLFIIYIADMPEASDIFNFTMYADDTTLTTTLSTAKHNIHSPDQINKAINDISIWLKTNKLSLNIKKTKYMIFHNSGKQFREPDFSIDGTKIERVRDYPFLGLTLDENLSWNKHIEKTRNKISRAIGVINRLKNFLPEEIRVSLYHTMITPYLQYCVLNWGHKISKLEKLQKKAVRIVSLSKYNAHSKPILKKLNLLHVEDIYKISILKFYYKYKRNFLPEAFDYITIKTGEESHGINTRQKKDMTYKTTKTNQSDNSLKIKIPKLINKLPLIYTETIRIHTYKGYANHLKKEFNKSYSENCSILDCYTCRDLNTSSDSTQSNN